jgi:hypothetical protein
MCLQALPRLQCVLQRVQQLERYKRHTVLDRLHSTTQQTPLATVRICIRNRLWHAQARRQRMHVLHQAEQINMLGDPR